MEVNDSVEKKIWEEIKDGIRDLKDILSDIENLEAKASRRAGKDKELKKKGLEYWDSLRKEAIKDPAKKLIPLLQALIGEKPAERAPAIKKEKKTDALGAFALSPVQINFIQERFSVNGAKKDWREIGKMAYEKAGKTLSSRTDTSIKRTIKSILKKYSDKDRGGRKLIFDAIQDEELKNRIAADLNNAEIFKIILENGFNT